MTYDPLWFRINELVTMPILRSTMSRLEQYVRPVCNYFALDAKLSQQQLKRLADHKYCAQNNSILDGLVMQKFWARVVTLFPLWVAPNLITVVGLLMNISSVLVLAYFTPDGTLDVKTSWYYTNLNVRYFFMSMDLNRSLRVILSKWFRTTILKCTF